MAGTTIQQGTFVSTGASVTLQLRNGTNWIRVYNYTAAAQDSANLAMEFYWQNGMPQGGGLAWTKLGGVANDPVTMDALVAPAGFTIVDSSSPVNLSSPVVITATGATNPIVVTTASTAGLVSGSIVRLLNNGQRQTGGIDWAIDTIVGNTSFQLAVDIATAPGGAGAGGTWQIVKFDPLFYPRHRYIANISVAAQAVVTLTVPSGYVVGQKVRVNNPYPTYFGMPQIDGLQGTVVAVNNAVGTQTITLDINSSAFSAFTWPTTAQANANQFSFPMIVPIGEDTAYALSVGANVLSDATINQGYIGVVLTGGADNPGGANNDVMYWISGSSFSFNS